MKYNIIDLNERNARTELKKYTFDEVLKFFEPSEELKADAPELAEKWDEINNVEDLKEFLNAEAGGMEQPYKIVENPDDLDILIVDGCTEAEAKKHLERGTMVYSDMEEKFDKYVEEWQLDEEEREAIRNMIDTKEPARDWGIVDIDGKTYFIQYVL